MSSINQYKLLNKKCELYFEIMEKGLGRKIDIKKDSDRPRFGFYLYMLECFTNIKDTNELIAKVTDTDFNKIIFRDASSDCGIDAVYIDEENRIINLLNFKYRETFKADKQQSQNDVFISTKFTSAILNNKSSHLEGKIKTFAKEIIKKNKSNDIWKMKLYMITNENVGLQANDKDIEQLKEVYDLEVISIALPQISSFMSNRPDPIDAKLVLEKDAILTYAENSLLSAKSYVIKIALPELIRITCNDKEYRDKYNIEDITPLFSKEMEFGVLFDNVRGFLGETKYNQGIVKTLETQPTKFFMFNNGLTITADDIIAEPFNGGRKILINIKNFQVVNGGQTLTTIHQFKNMKNGNLEKYLCQGEVLFRIFKTGSTDGLTNKIAEYTNSQNTISIIDLKSLATEQTQIEQILDDNNIIYARKIGDTGISEKKKYDDKISLERFAQILFSMQGNPEKASNQKKKIFEKYYDQTFGESNFDISKSADIVKRYSEIRKIYESKEMQYEISEQKLFYMMYLDGYYGKDIEQNIEILEEAIKEYKKSAKVSSARKLIQGGFKSFLNAKCKIAKIDL